MSHIPGSPEQPIEEPVGSLAGNLRFLAIAVVAIAAMVWIAMSSFDNEVYYLTVSEALEQADELGDDEFRIKGNVVAGSYRVNGENLGEHFFTLVADNQTIEVFYAGALPDTFADDAEVIALGSLDSGSERFTAVEVIAKCPSRYEEDGPTQAENHAGPGGA